MSNAVLVTGATGGLGYALCEVFHRKGYQVVGTTQQKNKKIKQVEKLEKLGISIYELDVTDFDGCEQLLERLSERGISVSILINNAGVTDDKSFKKMTPEQWGKVINTNLTGVFNLTRVVLPQMIEREYGRIISISSINGHKGQFGQANYAASKSALYGFTKSLAFEVAKKGITVNTVSPGYLRTDMTDAMSPEILSKIIDEIPVGRLGRTDEVARLVEFLADDQSSFITGTDFRIDGGQH
ncbi:3-oxoacyl-[acyl-carrier-protein] reductase /acetoacetyl-CoA reductase [Idiomarina aquatica]|uniref:3-oxoacyl-[acyl-carrier-protein] reductase /acetoacetyl-CoA reductase n=1 Tax=Idiomarina aquatica TaxID=1327752 RepID=A0A4R6PQS5_9GAMM|nr:3-oxoacyl-ACP reductase [Idiomarina aquatica]TDP40354.1 3-oxoacyl-[acyl-carrier-protein] reductase /acetoacetyl-CoA reductase [Idiomarina aquatica]